MADWRIERLERMHDRAAFSCGRPPLDLFIQRLVSQYEKRNLGRTYVAVRSGAQRVIGYYTLASGNIAFQNLPEPAARKLPKHPAPVILLARLAVDRSAQGKGVGAALLIDALSRCLTIADTIGVHAVEVDAVDEQAAAFYTRFGFSPLPDSALHLFLPTVTIRDSFSDQA